MLEVLKLFRVIVKAVRGHYTQVESRSGVSGAQLWALTSIADSPGIKVGDLARTLAVHQSTASNLLRRLESLGLVERSRTRDDQRSVRLALTAAGLDALASAPKPLIGVLQQALSDLAPSRLEGLKDHLEALVKVMKLKDPGARTTPLSEM